MKDIQDPWIVWWDSMDSPGVRLYGCDYGQGRDIERALHWTEDGARSAAVLAAAFFGAHTGCGPLSEELERQSAVRN